MAAKNNETKNMKTASKEDRDKALNEALAQIQKQFGKGAVMKLGDDSARMNIEAISTGSMSLDLATGIGGVPKGRIIEVFGPESSLVKLLDAISSQKPRNRAEERHSSMRSMHWIRNMPEIWGVDVDELLVSQPDYGEQALKSQKCWFVAARHRSGGGRR